MTMAAVLVIVVAVGEAHGPATEAVVAAAQRALPRQTSVRLVVVADPERVDLRRVRDDMGAQAVATVTWHPDSGAMRARVRVELAGGRPGTERTITFLPGDTASERGRTVGFAIASMWPDPAVPPPRAGPEARAAEEERRPANDNGRPREAAVPRDQTPPIAEEPVAPDSERRLELPAPPLGDGPARPPTVVAAVKEAPLAVLGGPVGLGVAATGAVGLGGTAPGAGASAEVVWRVGPTLGLRGMVGLRGGTIPALPGSHWMGAAGIGAEWWPVPLAFGSRWAVGARGDLLWTGQWVRRQAITDPADPAAGTPEEARARMLPGFDVLVRVAAAIRPSLHLLFGAGLEVALGRTDLRTGPERTVKASLPPARGVTDIALRYTF